MYIPAGSARTAMQLRRGGVNAVQCFPFGVVHVSVARGCGDETLASGALQPVGLVAVSRASRWLILETRH